MDSASCQTTCFTAREEDAEMSIRHTMKLVFLTRIAFDLLNLEFPFYVIIGAPARDAVHHTMIGTAISTILFEKWRPSGISESAGRENYAAVARFTKGQ
jgi:hypothetical protein